MLSAVWWDEAILALSVIAIRQARSPVFSLSAVWWDTATAVSAIAIRQVQSSVIQMSAGWWEERTLALLSAAVIFLS
jgi:hypothetical protein